MARSLTPLRSAISATGKPRFRRLTIVASRSALSCRAADERSRRGADGLGSTGSGKRVVSVMTMENKYRTWLPPWQEIVGFSEGAGRKKASGGKRENERLCPSE